MNRIADVRALRRGNISFLVHEPIELIQGREEPLHALDAGKEAFMDIEVPEELPKLIAAIIDGRNHLTGKKFRDVEVHVVDMPRDDFRGKILSGRTGAKYCCNIHSISALMMR